MDYFSKFLRSGQPVAAKPLVDYAAEFHRSWTLIQNTLSHPDERQLMKGIQSTDIPAHLKSLVDSLVWESTRAEEGTTGACLEYLLKNDVLGQLVRLSDSDRPFGVQLEVLRTVQSMVVLLDEQFLVHSVVHRAILRLLRTCIGDEIQEQLDGRNKAMGAAGASVRSQPSEYEEDLVDLLCLLCSRIRTHRELLMIFFHDKHWFQTAEFRNLETDVEDTEDNGSDGVDSDPLNLKRSSSPTPSQKTVTSIPTSSFNKKPEYEFLLFNYLLRFVHREGKIGDFARAGLLFLMDVAMSPGGPIHRIAGDEKPAFSSGHDETTGADPVTDAVLAFAEYVLDGDFSEVLAAGLGAVYSLLPSKLLIQNEISSENKNIGMTIGAHNGLIGAEKSISEKVLEFGIETSTNLEFKARLDHFLKLLEFFQDILRQKPSQEPQVLDFGPSSLVGSAIVQSILDAVRQIFFGNVLYPSILECSDADGSAVAVMSYIEIMIRTSQNSQIGNLLVDFLLSDDDSEVLRHRPRVQSELRLDDASAGAKVDKSIKLNRRKSSAMLLLEMEVPDTGKQSDYYTASGRFTLRDLLLTNIRSPSKPTVAAAMQLFNSLLFHHCLVTADRCLIVVSEDTTFTRNPVTLRSPIDEDEETFFYPAAQSNLETPKVIFSTSFSFHKREVKLYLDLVTLMNRSHDDDAFSTGFDHYLRDAILSLSTEHYCNHHDPDHVGSRSKTQLNPNDPFISTILLYLRSFFYNTPDVNVILTGILATLALCPNRSLGGWLTFSPHQVLGQRRDPRAMEDDGDDRSLDSAIVEDWSAGSDSGSSSSVTEDGYPVIYVVLRSLVQQLIQYRNDIDNFDKFFIERRQGLLFSETLSDALSLPLDSIVDTRPSETTLKPKAKSKSSSWSNLLSPRRSSKKVSRTDTSNTSSHQSVSTPVSTSPFAMHYDHTTKISVDPAIAPMPTSGPWAPNLMSSFHVDMSEQEDFGSKSPWYTNQGSLRDVFSIPETDKSEKKESANITLSQLLDNVVIMEESIKELAAIIHARRSLGMDIVSYL